MAVIGEMDVFTVNKDKQYEVVDRKSRQSIEKINKDVNNSNKDVIAGKVWKSTSDGAGWADSDSMSDNQSGGVDITIGGTKKTVAKQADLKEIEKSQNELKGDMDKNGEAISELADKKITKFYASNLGETTLNDSDNGKIQDMMMYGKSEQKSYSGKNLFKAKNEGIITVTDDGLLLNGTAENHQFINFTIPAGSYFMGEMNGEHSIHSFIDNFDSFMFDVGAITFETDKTLNFYITQGTYSNILIKPYIVEGSNSMETYEPYVGGIPSPNPDYPQEIKSVVNPKLEICGKNLVNKMQESTTVHGVTITNNGDGTYTLNGTNTSEWNGYDILKIKFNKNKTIRLTGGNGYAKVTLWNTKHNVMIAESFGSNPNVTVTLDPFIEYVVGILITDLTTFDNVVVKPMVSTVITDTYDDFEPYKGNKYTLPYTLNAIPVSSGGNVTIDGQEYIADYVDVERGKRVIVVDDSKLDPTVSITDNTDLLLDEPIEVDLTPEEVQMLRDLATNYQATNVFVTSDQLDGYTEFNYPVSLAEGWNYIKQQFGDTRDYIYDMDLQSAEAYVNSEYAVALAELEV